MPFDTPLSPEDRLRIEAPLARDPRLEPLLKPAHKAVPGHEWRGNMRGARGTARRANIDLRIRLRLSRPAISGEGCGLEFPYDATSDAQRAFAIDGPREGQTVRFDIVFGTPYFRDKPFRLTGEINAEETLITGTWTYSCGDCHCGGSGGTFRLARICLTG